MFGMDKNLRISSIFNYFTGQFVLFLPFKWNYLMKLVHNLSHVRENMLSGVCDQVRLKSACSATEAS